MASILALLCVVEAFPKPPRTIPPVNPDDPQRLPPGVTRNVLIVGGGLAGLSAALELAEKGYNVTIHESESYVGGRAHSVKFEALGQIWQVEHGFHAWFHNYHNFQDIRKRLDIDKYFVPWEAVDYIFKDYKPESIASKGPYPLNLLGIIFDSPNLVLTDALKAVLALPDLVEFDYNKVYQKYDNMTLDEWASLRRIPKDFFDIIIAPAASVTLNDKATISAAEMLMMMQLYFLSDSKADYRETATQNYLTALFNPWINKLQSFGVEIKLNSSVTAFVMDEESAAFTGITNDTTPGRYYDYVVMATDLPAIKNILTNTAEMYQNKPSLSGRVEKILQKITNLNVAPPYKVMRVWFDMQLEDSRAKTILETPNFVPINLVAQYHKLEKQYIEWANKTGGSVMEFHLYTWAHGDVPDANVWGIISPAVKQIYPEIFDRNFTILAYHVNTYQNFPSFEMGSASFRPNCTFAMQCGIPNAVFAGDWLHTSYPSALMERAVSTGREAANEILLKDRVKQVPLVVTSSYGPGIL
ncbi:carotenoid phi-ring synthase-like [Amphiura filiformis]|uniref:carotenoid phi-ring synthase-like n=1 Tax=Amphiura filiformis TaxID=82378 RepID=UPI003B2175AA